ncbi:MAG: DUF2782 domain-containing protein [Xanthomonadales bacterium]|nr:DUF2782 domain-containing protein [Xanthomonadales bacterium]MCC6595304.1 DUF2782 domain-containing protein [Rhodanobacteraceae bacterium]MDL1870001.1 DUF2782 domain-containing protein [Gammaproteobacteria bacterium PRO6]
MQSIIHAMVAGCALAFASSLACAQQRPTPAEVPPPPGLNDPAAAAPAPQATPAASAAAATPQPADDPLAPLPKPDARLVRDKASRDASTTQQRIAASQVTKRQQGSDTVEEYRQNGRIWMIRIVPINGPIQTFVTNDGSGRLVRDPREGPVSPVYYTLYEWK